MDLAIAIKRANQILDEELATPTIVYKPSGKALGAKDELTETLVVSLAAHNLREARAVRPRFLEENPSKFRFESINFDLLRAVLSQIPVPATTAFMSAMSLRAFSTLNAKKTAAAVYPKWKGLVSELPLLAEFLARTGGKEALFKILEADIHTANPGYVLMLRELEEIVALNYTVFSEGEYGRLRSALKVFHKSITAAIEKCAHRGPGEILIYGSLVYEGLGTVAMLELRSEIAEACRSIDEGSRKAQYLYLKGSLLEGLNLEVNQDRAKVEEYLVRFQFTPTLRACLDEVDRLYQSGTTPFHLKSCLGHLRSFLESLQKESLPSVHAKYGGNLPSSWGGGLAYLLQHKILSKTEEQFASTFYALISDEGVHPLIAEREYARLARNMVIEYALLFLTKLEKLGATKATRL